MIFQICSQYPLSACVLEFIWYKRMQWPESLFIQLKDESSIVTIAWEIKKIQHFFANASFVGHVTIHFLYKAAIFKAKSQQSSNIIVKEDSSKSVIFSPKNYKMAAKTIQRLGGRPQVIKLYDFCLKNNF